MHGFAGEKKETEHLKDLNAEGTIMLKQILNKTEWLEVDRIFLGLDRNMTGSCENGYESSGSVKLQSYCFIK
jgi:hypothetical protein